MPAIEEIRRGFGALAEQGHSFLHLADGDATAGIIEQILSCLWNEGVFDGGAQFEGEGGALINRRSS